MPALWETLGYDEIAADIAHGLRDSDGIQVLAGPPGVGKSYLARAIGALWESAGGRAVVAEGDESRSGFAYYPFGAAMEGVRSGTWKDLAPAVVSVTKVGEGLLGTGGAITSTIQALAAVRRSRKRNPMLYLGNREQEVLHNLERLSRNEPLLIIADNLHWWDERSLGLLRFIHQPKVSSGLPFLATMRVLAVETVEPYQSVAHPAAHDALLDDERTRRRDLTRIPSQRFKQVLVALGAPSTVSAEAVDSVYAFSGGHLALASRAASWIAAGNAEVLLSSLGPVQFAERLLTQRIHSLGDLGKDIIDLLETAAILGQVFRRDEVACASLCEHSKIPGLLQYCRDEGLLEVTDEIGRFVHDLYRQFFLDSVSQDRVALHNRLADCLRILSPADYGIRSLMCLGAARLRDAATFGILSILQGQREGLSRDIPEQILEVIEARGLFPIVETFDAAHDCLVRYQFQECMAALDSLPRDLAKPLLAEADYLRAMCLMSTRSEEDRSRGRILLESWAGYEEDEPDLGVRILRLLLYGLTHLQDKEPGRRLEGRIKQILIDRVVFDSAATDDLYIMDRCSAALYEPDVSLVRIREAVEHFGPAEGEAVLRRPVEYYRCLVNLGAALISNGRYADACPVFGRAETVIRDYPKGTFPRIDHLEMNALLAAFRLGSVTAGDAVERQRDIVTALSIDADPFYVGNALAVYLTLDDKYTEALQLFDRLDRELRGTRTEPEPSMVYLIGANRAAARFVAGDLNRAQSEWIDLSEVVSRIAYSIRTILIRRHELLGLVIADGTSMSSRDFDRCLLDAGSIEFGPLWDNFGRGFRMPEVEFWREN